MKFLPFLTLLITLQSGAQNKLSTQDLFSKASPSVILIEGKNSIGSGFFITAYLVLTNYHVVQNFGQSFTYRLSYNNIKMPIRKVVCYDSTLDLAVLEVEDAGIPLKFGFTELSSGSKVYSIGNPMGLKSIISEGLFSGNFIINGTERMQFNAAISPGSSGGPIMNESGDVVGVNVSSLKNGQSINFGVPMNSVCAFLKENKIISSCYITDDIKEISIYKLKHKNSNDEIGLLSFDEKFKNCIIKMTGYKTILTGKLDDSGTFIQLETNETIPFPIVNNSNVSILNRSVTLSNK